MGKRFKSGSRFIRIEAELTRIAGEVYSGQTGFPCLKENWVPCVDISEKIDCVILKIELPGVQPADINLMLSNHRMEIRGIKKVNRIGSATKYIRLEREYGAFRREVFLPAPVVPEKAEAVLEDGVLTVTMRKQGAEKSREIKLDIHHLKEPEGGKDGQER